MRPIRAAAAVLGTSAGWVLAVAAAGALAAPEPFEPVPRELIIHFKEGSPAERALAGARRLHRGVSVVKIDAGDDRPRRGKPDSRAERWSRLHAQMDNWRGREGVRRVEPNHYGRFEAVPDAPAPNDPEFADQWWLGAVGALGLWPIGRGEGVTVALVDSGVSLTHPDLAANLEADGYDFGDRDANPEDGLGHGTGVAGVIAALTDNGLGVAGLAPAVRLLPLKINVGNTTQFDAATVAEAVDYAVAKGVRVINLSVVFEQPNEWLRERIQNALDHGIAVVAAAGNDGNAVWFPADMPGVIAVASTDREGGLYSSSSRGPEVAIAAPGTSILTTRRDGGYASVSGTSYAAPMVSAALAALMSINDSLPVATLKSLLRETATPLTDQSVGQPFGQLNAALAALTLLPAMTPTPGPWTPQRSFEASYRVPPLVAPADIYVAVATPAGEFALLPDCSWAEVASAGYRPFARAYSAAEPGAGVLFGPGGLCAAVPLAGLPAGIYVWRVAATTGAGRLIGAVNSEAIEVAR